LRLLWVRQEDGHRIKKYDPSFVFRYSRKRKPGQEARFQFAGVGAPTIHLPEGNCCQL
jgi:hypothetical protein